jgi:hypothetical protein
MARGHISASFHLQRSNKSPLESSRQGAHDRAIISDFIKYDPGPVFRPTMCHVLVRREARKATQPAFSPTAVPLSPRPARALLIVGFPPHVPPTDPVAKHRGLRALPAVDLSPILPDGSPDPSPAPAGRFRLMQQQWDTLINDEYASSVIRVGVVPELTSALPPRYPQRRRVPAGPPTAMQLAEAELVSALYEQRVLDALTDGVPPPDSSPCPVSLRMPEVVPPWYSAYFLVPKPTVFPSKNHRLHVVDWTLARHRYTQVP